jgi:hypothetical protein
MHGDKTGAPDTQPTTPSATTDAADPQARLQGQRRQDPRYPLPVRAVVAIPGLPEREYGVCEISRSGMFLAFLDIDRTRPEFRHSKAGPGSTLEIEFEVTHPEVHFRCQIPAQIVRTTHSGIGIHVGTDHQPDLDALISMLPSPRTRVGGDPV